MADQEFLASFAVEIDESGIEKLQKALTQNRELADELASAFDAAREAVGDFFRQLSASTLPTGELSPYQRLMDLSEGGFSFELDLDTVDAEEQLDSFLQQAQELFEETRFPLGADAAPALSAGNEVLQQLQDLFSSSALPLDADAQEVLSAGQSALAELLRGFSSTLLPLNADASAVNSSGQTALRQLQDLFSTSALPLDADPAKALSAGQSALGEIRQRFSSTLLPLEADASAVISAGQAALRQLQDLYSSATLTLHVREVRTSGSSGGTPGSSATQPAASPFFSLARAAAGGRFDAPTKAEIAEDGDPEYVIPVKKESAALPLLRQLIGELSDSARDTLRAALNQKEPGDVRSGRESAARADALSGLPDLLASAPAAAAPVVTQTANNSVQAPVSINVTAAGTDPEAVGKSVYDVAEQYLLRTLRGAL